MSNQLPAAAAECMSHQPPFIFSVLCVATVLKGQSYAGWREYTDPTSTFPNRPWCMWWWLSVIAGDAVAPGKYKSLPYDGVWTEPVGHDDVIVRLVERYLQLVKVVLEGMTAMSILKYLRMTAFFINFMTWLSLLKRKFNFQDQNLSFQLKIEYFTKKSCYPFVHSFKLTL